MCVAIPQSHSTSSWAGFVCIFYLWDIFEGFISYYIYVVILPAFWRQHMNRHAAFLAFTYKSTTLVARNVVVMISPKKLNINIRDRVFSRPRLCELRCTRLDTVQSHRSLLKLLRNILPHLWCRTQIHRFTNWAPLPWGCCVFREMVPRTWEKKIVKLSWSTFFSCT
jgi:hypothetical protein